jgi:ribonuclease P protein component
MMLPKKKRLTTEAFNRFFRAGRRSHSTNLTLIHTPAGEFHGAVVVGKKVFKSAVKRNRLRRQLYAALYRAHVATPVTGTFIVIAKPGARAVDSPLLIAELKDLIGRTVK